MTCLQIGINRARRYTLRLDTNHYQTLLIHNPDPISVNRDITFHILLVIFIFSELSWLFSVSILLMFARRSSLLSSKSPFQKFSVVFPLLFLMFKNIFWPFEHFFYALTL